MKMNQQVISAISTVVPATHKLALPKHVLTALILPFILLSPPVLTQFFHNILNNDTLANLTGHSFPALIISGLCLAMAIYLVPMVLVMNSLTRILWPDARMCRESKGLIVKETFYWHLLSAAFLVAVIFLAWTAAQINLIPSVS